MGSPIGSSGKEPFSSVGEVRILRSGRSFGRGNGSPLQYSCPENHMVREAWQATVHSKDLEMTKRLTISLFFLGVLEVIVYIDIPRITYNTWFLNFMCS